MVCTETDMKISKEVNIVHSGNMITNADQTNAVYVSDMSKCGLNVLSIANDDSGLGNPIEPIETNTQEKPCSESVQCKHLDAIESKQGKCHKNQWDDNNNDNMELVTTIWRSLYLW